MSTLHTQGFIATWWVKSTNASIGGMKHGLLLEIGNVAIAVSTFKLLNDSCNEYNVKVADNFFFHE